MFVDLFLLIYYNNEYCLELLNLAFGDEKVDTFMGRNLGKLDNYLVKRYNEMMELVYNKQVLIQEDQDFLVNNFLSYASDIGIYKDEMPDIVAFVEQYPIKDFNNFKNRCLYMLYLLSLELMNIKREAIIKFDDASNGNVLGGFAHNDTKVKVVIYNINTYYLGNIKEFLDKLFTLYHELCHVYQKDNSDEYDDDTLQRFYIENEVIKNNYDFYIKYHDNFMIEIDADNYASNRLINGFGKSYTVEVDEIINEKKKLRDKMKIDDNKFLELLYREYDTNYDFKRKK